MVLSITKRIFKSEFSKGAYSPIIMIASVLFLGLATAIAGFALSSFRDAKSHEKTVSALDVAEAGVNYYIWHLGFILNHLPLLKWKFWFGCMIYKVVRYKII